MSDAPPIPDRIDCLLGVLQKALGHELPNYLVAIQGLARVLEMDQAQRLDDEGKDHLRRVAVAAQRAHELTLTLADRIRSERRCPNEKGP